MTGLSGVNRESNSRVRKSVWMFGIRNQPEQIDYVDEPYF